MKLTVERTYLGSNYTIGHLYINGKFFCDTLEDVDRGLTKEMSLRDIQKKKVKGKTCIPYGTYKVSMDVVSPKYSNYIKYPYALYVKGKMPRVLDVPRFDGILIHPGSTATDTDGCLLVGENKVKGKVINSQYTWKKLCTLLMEANNRKELITITYTKCQTAKK